jgi:hypothetical protein
MKHKSITSLLILLVCICGGFYFVTYKNGVSSLEDTSRISSYNLPILLNPDFIPTPPPMNDNYSNFLEEYKICQNKATDLHGFILSKFPADVKIFGEANRKTSLRYVSHAEWVYINLLSFFAVCENHGTLWIDTQKGYALREYMLEVGIEKCAAVFLQLKPLQVKNDQLEGDSDTEEFADRAALIDEEMKKIEREMPSESYEEICVLLWKYAQKHGLDKMLERAAPDKEGNTSPP